MSWLDWNSIENSRQGIAVSYRVQYKFSRSPSSSIQDILPPFPVVKNPDNFIITFAAERLNWKAEYELDEMCEDTWHWQSQNPNGYSNV